MSKQLDAYQIGTLCFFLTRAAFPLFGYHFLFKHLSSDSITAFLIAVVITILLFIGVIKLRRNNKFNIKNKSIFLLFILILIFFFYLKECSLFIQKQFIDIPLIFIMILMFFSAYLLAKDGFHSLGSNSFILFFFFFLFYILTLLGGIPLVNLDYLKPFLTSFNSYFIKDVLLTIFILSPSWLIFIFIPQDKVNEPKKQEKIFFSYFILGCLSIFLEMFLMYLTLGSKLTSLYPYPLFALTSRISSFLLLDRIFFLFSFYLLIDSTLFLSVILELIKIIIGPYLLILRDKVVHPFVVSQNKFPFWGK